MGEAIHLLFPLATSAAISAGLCYCLARWSVRLRLVAQPRPDRWHMTPTPNTGGLGVLIACACAYPLYTGQGFRAVAAGAALISMLGFVDDRLQLRPVTKLAGQGVTAILLVAGGTSFHLTPWIWVDAIIAVFWLVAITNAFNLIDNMDGLCGGVAAIVAVAGACLALLQGDLGRGLLFAVIAGACIGFLIFNHKPARIFLGDCGSLFLGFSLASLALSPPGAPARHTVVDSLYLIPAFLYPIFDMTMVSVLRIRAGKPISMGGRDHSSHRLVCLGLNERNAVWVLWLCSALCAACPLFTYRNPPWFSAVTAFLLTGLALLGSTLAFFSGLAAPRATQVQRGSSSAP